MSFAEGKVIYPDNPWCRIWWRSSLSDYPQEGISTDRHAQVFGLPLTSFATKRETQLLQSGGQSHSATCCEGHERREPLREGLLHTSWIEAAEAPNP
jgi:hypothetical protein